VDEPQTALTCPVCFGPLTVGPSAVNCSKSHTYDRAREGYLNLLLANQKGSNDPGDDRDSVAARREFLAAGHYDFLPETIDRIVARHEDSPGVIADAGCGEGYYLARQARKFPDAACYGFDISRSAMRLASRSYGDCTWAVANIARRLPLTDKSCDLLLSIMAPRNATEFERVLKLSGQIVVVVPGDYHLGQLTDLLMTKPSDQSAKPDIVTRSLSPAFNLESSQNIKIDFSADQATIQKLVTMTPLRWKSRRNSLENLLQIDRLNITASFKILQYALAANLP